MSTPTVDAIIVTYNRPRFLAESLRAALEQTMPPRMLVVVDNSVPPIAQPVVDEIGGSATELVVLHPGANLGPAGGFAAGFRCLRDRLGDLDWVLFLDDDDPLPEPSVIERLLAALATAESGSVGGVALMGAVFRPALLLPAPVDLRNGGLVEVDWLHGWAAPMYRAEALAEVGGVRSELFFGLDELDLGIRLRRAGWQLYMAAGVYRSLPTPRKVIERPGRPRFHVEQPSGRDYYRVRNTVDIGLRYFRLRNVLLAITVRALLKPIANLPLHPRVAIRSLRQNIRAIIDGFRGRLGETFSLRD
jgi:GT2 family glycosyltransferase